MAQKPVLRAERECTFVAPMARATIRGRGWPSPSQRARYLWVLRTQEIHGGRRLNCGTRSSIIAEVKIGRSTHMATLCSAPGQRPRQGKSSFLSLKVAVKREVPKIDIMSVGRLWPSRPPPFIELTHKSFIKRHGRYVVVFQHVTKTLARPSV